MADQLTNLTDEQVHLLSVCLRAHAEWRDKVAAQALRLDTLRQRRRHLQAFNASLRLTRDALANAQQHNINLFIIPPA